MAGYSKGDISDLKSPKVKVGISEKKISEKIKKIFWRIGKSKGSYEPELAKAAWRGTGKGIFWF
jgi:hypothetical protein